MGSGLISSRKNRLRDYYNSKNKGICVQRGCNNKPEVNKVRCKFHYHRYKLSKKKHIDKKRWQK